MYGFFKDTVGIRAPLRFGHLMIGFYLHLYGRQIAISFPVSLSFGFFNPSSVISELRLNRMFYTSKYDTLKYKEANLGTGAGIWHYIALAEINRHMIDFIGRYTWEELCREWVLRSGALGRFL